jgi:hypothetical protein
VSINVCPAFNRTGGSSRIVLTAPLSSAKTDAPTIAANTADANPRFVHLMFAL